jgi:hypothetical protein
MVWVPILGMAIAVLGLVIVVGEAVRNAYRK